MNFDPNSSTFEFYLDDDLDLAGDSFNDYTIKYRGTVGEVVDDSEFGLRVKNPCIDPAYVEIVTAPLAPQSYILYYQIDWQHEPFFLKT